MRISDWSSDVCSSDLLPAGDQAVVAVQIGWRDSDIALRSCGWHELVPDRIDIGQAPAVASLIDPPSQHVDSVAPGGDTEQRDGTAAGLPSLPMGLHGFPGPPAGGSEGGGGAVEAAALANGERKG